MIFTKEQLIQEVQYHRLRDILMEVNIDDVLSGKHYKDVEGEVNSLAKYQDVIPIARKFLTNIVNYITASEKNLNQWIHMMYSQFGYDARSLLGAMNVVITFMNSNDVQAWAQSKVTDELIVDALVQMKYDAAKNNELKQHIIAVGTHINLAHVLSEFVHGQSD